LKSPRDPASPARREGAHGDPDPQEARSISSDRHRAPPSSHRALHRLLTAALGNPKLASRAVSGALASANLEAMPHEPNELVNFVQRHLFDVLSADLGQRIAIAVIHDLAADLGVSVDAAAVPAVSAESSHARIRSRPAVEATGASARTRAAPLRLHLLLVGDDRFECALLARALVGRGWDVTVATSADEVRRTLAGGSEVHVVLTYGAATAFRELPRVLGERTPSIPCLARGSESTPDDITTALHEILKR
jgi:hypothetical protein